MPVNFGGPGVRPSLGALVSNEVSLQAGAVWPVPSGRWAIKQGKYTTFQEYDPITGTWRTPGAGASSGGVEVVFSDGTNYRLANQTGCPIGAIVTTAGSGYLSATPPTVTASAGGSVWTAVVGGAVATSVTVTAGGTGYTYPPIVLFSSPPPGGIPATGHCTLSAGAVSTVTVDDQGAGYNAAPTITFQNDPREGLNGVAQGSGAQATATLTGAGTVTALLLLDHGSPQTAIPTLTFSSGSAAGTVCMCWTITAYTVSTTTAGSGYAAPVIISGYDNPPTGSVLTNPFMGASQLKGRMAFIVGSTSGTAVTATGQSVKDGGVYTGTPTLFAYGFIQGAGAVQAVLSPTMGGQNDTSLIVQT
jgi:hypothetical protein